VPFFQSKEQVMKLDPNENISVPVTVYHDIPAEWFQMYFKTPEELRPAFLKVATAIAEYLAAQEEYERKLADKQK
jgi:hypothetical protein